MRHLLVLLVVLVMSCGDDTTPPAPKDLSVTPHDCAGLVTCACLDGTCQVISACGSVRCADICLSHGGAGGMLCSPGDAGP